MTDEEENEFGEKKSNLSQLAFVGIICFMLGASIVGLILFDDTLPEPIVGGLLDEPVCLTSVDLNRDDIYLGIIYGRHCESLGMQSGLFWEQDAEGRKYALPICLEISEESS